MEDNFKYKAKEWDKGDKKVNSADENAEAIKKRINLHKEMQILDFGVGTGLLGFNIAKEVKKVYGVDTSASMLEKLKEKNTEELSIETYCQDIVATPLTKTFDGMVSSMTLHHIQNLKEFFETIYKNIKDNGFIAVIDLEEEDGTFHSDNKGVFHFGFNEKEICDIVSEAGFNDINFQNINTISKAHKNFGVFLLTAKKQVKKS